LYDRSVLTAAEEHVLGKRAAASPGGISSIQSLHESVRKAAVEFGLDRLTEPQRRALKPILHGQNVLLVAPTGSGKTEAALLPVFSKMVERGPVTGISAIYITPLRALNRDMLRRLQGWGRRLHIEIQVRHGDTPKSVRRKQSLKPPDLLITTPETLQAILPGSRMQRNLKTLRTVIVDEIHQIAENKRGAQLALGLERLRAVVARDFQRIGLSATVGSPNIAAQLLTGSGSPPKIIQVEVPKSFKYRVEWPVPTEEDYELAQTLYTSPEAAARITRIKEMVDSHKSTLIFVNSRQIAEMLAVRFGVLDQSIGIHHGSLSREERHRIEDSFKSGETRAIICTSTLELGIDIGTVDMVLQYLSPRQVTPLIQRVGRSGHRLGLVSRGHVISAFTDDSLESIAAIRRARQKKLEPLIVQENALDVLAHQIAGMVMDRGEIKEKEAYKLSAKAYPYRGLSFEDFHEVVVYLEQIGLLGRKQEGLTRTRNTRSYYFENLSMIPDERRYPVVDLTADRFIGTVGDEFMLYRARLGLNFICRGLVWRIKQISEDGRVYVLPVEDPTAALPGWDGEILPVPYELANEAGTIRREIGDLLSKEGPKHVVNRLSKKYPAERYALRKIVEEIAEHIDRGAPVPNDRTVLVEGFDRYMIINSCLGESANNTLGRICDNLLSERGITRFWWADGYRVLIELTSQVTNIDFPRVAKEIFSMSQQEAERRFFNQIKARFPFGYYMKFVAERFGALARGRSLPESEQTDFAHRFLNTPVYKETMRQALLEKVDIERVKEILSSVARGETVVETLISTEKPTPISYHILNRFAEIPEVMAPETVEKETIDRIKNAILSTSTEILCVNCGGTSENVWIKDLPDRPVCAQCQSPLIAVHRRPKPWAQTVVKKWIDRQPLSEEETKILSDTRRNADIVLSYGKSGIMAMMVYGVGPQTASRILAKMHYNEEALFRDLLEAKLKYIQTRPFWEAG